MIISRFSKFGSKPSSTLLQVTTNHCHDFLDYRVSDGDEREQTASGIQRSMFCVRTIHSSSGEVKINMAMDSLLIPLNTCRRKNMYLPWECEDERHVYEKWVCAFIWIMLLLTNRTRKVPIRRVSANVMFIGNLHWHILQLDASHEEDVEAKAGGSRRCRRVDVHLIESIQGIFDITLDTLSQRDIRKRGEVQMLSIQ